MLAYHNDAELKKSVVDTMAKHRKADTLLQGYGYWKDGKGCAVGCLIQGSDHSEYETRFGIPRILARLEDRIFEGLPVEEARKWPERFLSAIKPGADLSSVWPKFAVFMMTDKERGVLKYAKNDKTKKAIQEVADLYQRIVNGETIDANKWIEARKSAAAAYAADAAYADDAAAYAAAYAAAAYAAYAAAYAAAAAADGAAAYAAAAYAAAAADAYAAYADAAAAYAADAAATYADDAAAYAAAARWRHYVALSIVLVRFLGEAEVPKKKAD